MAAKKQHQKHRTESKKCKCMGILSFGFWFKDPHMIT